MVINATRLYEFKVQFSVAVKFGCEFDLIYLLNQARAGFVVQWNIAVAIPVNVSSCLLYMWPSDITVVSLHQHYNTYSTWFLDIRIYQLVLI